MCKRERERINMVSDTINMNCNWYEIKGERERESVRDWREEERKRKRERGVVSS